MTEYERERKGKEGLVRCEEYREVTERGKEEKMDRGDNDTEEGRRKKKEGIKENANEKGNE